MKYVGCVFQPTPDPPSAVEGVVAVASPLGLLWQHAPSIRLRLNRRLPLEKQASAEGSGEDLGRNSQQPQMIKTRGLIW